MRVAAWVGDGTLEVGVCDDADGTASRRDSPGLGLALLTQVVDRLRLESGGRARHACG